MRVAIAGSSGFIGTALVRAIESRGDHVIRIVRRPPSDPAHEVEWHPERGQFDGAVLDGVDAVINLAGEGIGDRRWSSAQKQRILDSRVAATTLLAEAIARCASPPRTPSALNTTQ